MMGTWAGLLAIVKEAKGTDPKYLLEVEESALMMGWLGVECEEARIKGSSTGYTVYGFRCQKKGSNLNTLVYDAY